MTCHIVQTDREDRTGLFDRYRVWLGSTFVRRWLFSGIVTSVIASGALYLHWTYFVTFYIQSRGEVSERETSPYGEFLGALFMLVTSFSMCLIVAGYTSGALHRWLVRDRQREAWEWTLFGILFSLLFGWVTVFILVVCSLPESWVEDLGIRKLVAWVIYWICHSYGMSRFFSVLKWSREGRNSEDRTDVQHN